MKDFLRSQFQDWYAKKLHKQLQEQSTEVIPIDMKMSLMKPLSAKWIESMFLYFKDNPSIVRNGFKRSWHYKLFICVVVIQCCIIYLHIIDHTCSFHEICTQKANIINLNTKQRSHLCTIVV